MSIERWLHITRGSCGSIMTLAMFCPAQPWNLVIDWACLAVCQPEAYDTNPYQNYCVGFAYHITTALKKVLSPKCRHHSHHSLPVTTSWWVGVGDKMTVDVCLVNYHGGMFEPKFMSSSPMSSEFWGFHRANMRELERDREDQLLHITEETKPKSKAFKCEALLFAFSFKHYNLCRFYSIYSVWARRKFIFSRAKHNSYLQIKKPHVKVGNLWRRVLMVEVARKREAIGSSRTTFFS